MTEGDNFKRQNQPSLKGKAIDGISSSKTIKSSAGSISFDKSDSKQLETGKIGDFRRPEGFHPGVQPLIGAASDSINERSIGNRPRQHIAADDVTPLKGRQRHQKKQISKKRKIIRHGILIAVALIVIVGSFLGWKFLRNTSKIFGGGGIFGFFDSTSLRGEDQGRVNILLAGNSEDDPGHAGAALTDSIMLISLDTINNTGFIMSIPRDLWVDYGIKNCAVGYQGKINAAYVCGEQIKFHENNYPYGGMGLLEKVVEQNFGIDIHYYARINYTAFKDAVNAVGGIDVTIKTNDPRGLYDGNISKVDGGPLKLSNGLNHLNGQTALNLARARCEAVCYGFTNGDFDRTEHQRQMLLVLKDKALSVGVLSNPAKISSLLDAAGNNVKTDFKTNEVRRLYDIIKKIDTDNIKSIGLADSDVKLVQTASINGTSLVRPVAGLSDFSQIKAFMKKLTSNDPVVKEGSTVVVLNGSGKVGLAQRKANILSARGLSIKTVANAEGSRPNTVVVVVNGGQKPATKAYLEQTFKTTSSSDLSTYSEAKNYQTDFVIILGQNEANSQ